jgi:type VI secretion system protein ImpM
MQCSLYGKLPTKRDFVAVGAPREFLSAWEPWVQGGVSASRATLGEQWQNAFLRAPIWRFWLGAELCGASVIGAFMPSLDGVGRYFPLTLFACADQGAAIPPPEIDAQDEWFKGAEEFLISTLDHDKTFEMTMTELEALAAPLQAELPKASTADMIVESDGTLGVKAGERPFADLFGSLRAADHERIYAATSCWWTVGGEDFAPFALCGKRMPDPFLFAAMLTGQFSAVEAGATPAT